jgi:multicomponent K+:H+ antiporter subunit E
MKRLLPHPLLSLALAAAWLLLNLPLAPTDVIAAAVVAVGGGALYAVVRVPAAPARLRVGVALELLALLAADVVQSNLAVARLVLAPRRGRVAGFVTVPLELAHPVGLAALACIVTSTPGTSWGGYDAARSLLTIHVLDLVDERAWVEDFKRRYERRLLEIFP